MNLQKSYLRQWVQGSNSFQPMLYCFDDCFDPLYCLHLVFSPLDCLYTREGLLLFKDVTFNQTFTERKQLAHRAPNSSGKDFHRFLFSWSRDLCYGRPNLFWGDETFCKGGVWVHWKDCLTFVSANRRL